MKGGLEGGVVRSRFQFVVQQHVAAACCGSSQRAGKGDLAHGNRETRVGEVRRVDLL